MSGMAEQRSNARANGSLKGDFKIVKELRSLSGAGWDAEAGLVILDPDVWDQYITAHPKAAPFRTRGFPLYDDIATIVGGILATGDEAVSSSQILDRFDNSSSSSDDDDDDDGTVHVAAPAASEEATADADDVTADATASVPPTAPPTPPPPPSSSPKKRKRTERVSSASAMYAMADSMNSMVAALGASIEPDTSQAGPSHLSTPARKNKAFNMIAEEEGLSDDELVVARKLFRGPGRAELADEYLSFGPDRKASRRKWLRQELDELHAQAV
ncbi:hypothetical protein FA95DRAFT_1614262 [Auriscalpium vulgare]|uniref:Uncharacterized protein n=1 Tax=Auriscalpium vulgare TaxID=40419 RepID=A0ACB8R018_9AGAM|nr:hypothetical protein FA95DRAFT_1614262 [Auriscalpium vulgare]